MSNPAILFVELSASNERLADELDDLGLRVLYARGEREAVDRVCGKPLHAIVVAAACQPDGADRRRELRMVAGRLARRIRAAGFVMPIFCILDLAGREDELADLDGAFEALPATTTACEIGSRLMDVIAPSTRQSADAGGTAQVTKSCPRDIDALIRNTRRLLDQTHRIIASLR